MAGIFLLIVWKDTYQVANIFIWVTFSADIILELYRWGIQAYMWKKESDESDEDFQVLKKAPMTMSEAEDRRERYERRV